MASILKGQSGQPIQFETVPNVNGDDVLTTVDTARILQIQTSIVTTTAVYSSVKYTPDVCTLEITPKSDNSKFFITFQFSGSSGQSGVYATLFMDGQLISEITPNSVGSRRVIYVGGDNTANGVIFAGGTSFLLDNLNSETKTFSIRLTHNVSSTATVYLNRTVGDGDTAGSQRGVTSITIMEIEQ